MSEERFDAIIVGGGLAGSAAAYVLAQEGMAVLVIEKGNYCGSKNMTGGRIYTHSLEKLIPDFADRAPLERKIVKEKYSFLTNDGGETLEYTSKDMGLLSSDSYSVLRGPFDTWLAEEAENAEAMYVCGIRVDDLMVQNGQVCGVIAGDEEMEADVVILADGVNSLLAQKLGLKKEILPAQTAVGVKEVFRFTEEEVSQRFGINNGEGVAWLFNLKGIDEHLGEGFLYTNKDTVSAGILTSIEEIPEGGDTMTDRMEQFIHHPMIEPLLEGGKLAEYSAHLLPEGGKDMVPQLCGNGVLIAGDAAGFVINQAYTVRGMDFAIESGILAAKAVLAAKEAEDYSKETLSCYVESLKESFIMKELEAYGDGPKKACRQDLINAGATVEGE